MENNVKNIFVSKVFSTIDYITQAVEQRDIRLMGKVVRNIVILRKFIKKYDFANVVREISSLFELDAPFVDILNENPSDIDMEHPVVLPKPLDFYTQSKPELACLFTILTVYNLFDKKEIDKSEKCTEQLIKLIKQLNRRTLDSLLAVSYCLLSNIYELKDKLDELRSQLLNAHRDAVCHHDDNGRAVYLNLLLRNYIHYKMYDAAQKLATNTVYPESQRSNTQFTRYLYYTGKLRAIQLEYSDALSKLTLALRKIPQGDIGKGFRVQVRKFAIIVELLVGETPEKKIFYEKYEQNELIPYKELCITVRNGDVNEYKKVIEKHSAAFAKDNTLSLVRRLKNTVVLAGLRKLSTIYQRIYLKDVVHKLLLENEDEAISIIQKAIKDKIIDGEINLNEKSLVCVDNADIYSSKQPQIQLHKRILFCLQMRNDTVKALVYQEKKNETNESEEAEKKRLRELDEDAAAIAEEMEDDDDF